mmetsp:Transcript_5968/g.16724  ORF Transcript_5968/g.16724 Transcript_5968/m.16724 type:complete len:205 (+) Transcript_5968:414-1028(+)
MHIGLLRLSTGWCCLGLDLPGQHLSIVRLRDLRRIEPNGFQRLDEIARLGTATNKGRTKRVADRGHRHPAAGAKGIGNRLAAVCLAHHSVHLEYDGLVRVLQQSLGEVTNLARIDHQIGIKPNSFDGFDEVAGLADAAHKSGAERVAHHNRLGAVTALERIGHCGAAVLLAHHSLDPQHSHVLVRGRLGCHARIHHRHVVGSQC